MARQLIDVAAGAGADAVKFQTFRAQEFVSRRAPKAEYQNREGNPNESQLEMLRKLELKEADHEVLIAHARSKGIAFLSSPFDFGSLALLTARFGLKTIKIPSGEITNAPFLLAIARAATRVILSTGMSTLAEIEAALGVLAFGYLAPITATPRSGDFARAFSSNAGQEALRSNVTLLHCSTEYPTPVDEVNLRAIETMAVAFNLPVGYSDHTLGVHISLAAVARGAQVIEKHFTLNRSLPGPDHKASLEPFELHELVRQIRDIEKALGDGIKRPGASEAINRDIARKSLVAERAIKPGEMFTIENLVCKRPGTGISPMHYWEYLGATANSSFDCDEAIK